jgi:hypothetical protein
MSPQSVQNVKVSLQAWPVAMLFSKQLLLTWTVPDKSGAPAAEKEGGTFTVRATKLTAILKGIKGYSHGGLNE